MEKQSSKDLSYQWKFCFSDSEDKLAILKKRSPVFEEFLTKNTINVKGFFVFLQQHENEIEVYSEIFNDENLISVIYFLANIFDKVDSKTQSFVRCFNVSCKSIFNVKELRKLQFYKCGSCKSAWKIIDLLKYDLEYLSPFLSTEQQLKLFLKNPILSNVNIPKLFIPIENGEKKEILFLCENSFHMSSTIEISDEVENQLIADSRDHLNYLARILFDSKFFILPARYTMKTKNFLNGLMKKTQKKPGFEEHMDSFKIIEEYYLKALPKIYFEDSTSKWICCCCVPFNRINKEEK